MEKVSFNLCDNSDVEFKNLGLNEPIKGWSDEQRCAIVLLNLDHDFREQFKRGISSDKLLNEGGFKETFKCLISAVKNRHALTCDTQDTASSFAIACLKPGEKIFDYANHLDSMARKIFKDIPENTIYKKIMARILDFLPADITRFADL